MGDTAENVELSKERLEILLFKERKNKRATMRRRDNLREKRVEIDRKLATAEAELTDHRRKVATLKEELRRIPSPD